MFDNDMYSQLILVVDSAIKEAKINSDNFEADYVNTYLLAMQPFLFLFASLSLLLKITICNFFEKSSEFHAPWACRHLTWFNTSSDDGNIVKHYKSYNS